MTAWPQHQAPCSFEVFPLSELLKMPKPLEGVKKKPQALEEGYGLPRSRLGSGLHRWVSKLLSGSNGQRASLSLSWPSEEGLRDAYC